MNAYSAASKEPLPAPPIDPAWTVNELLRREPWSAAILNAFGIDTCCGGGDSLAIAAGEAGIGCDELLGALTDARAHAGRRRQ